MSVYRVERKRALRLPYLTVFMLGMCLGLVLATWKPLRQPEPEHGVPTHDVFEEKTLFQECMAAAMMDRNAVAECRVYALDMAQRTAAARGYAYKEEGEK
jgi:hypothetical protein